MSEEGTLELPTPHHWRLVLQWSLAPMSEEGMRGMSSSIDSVLLQWSLAPMSEEGCPYRRFRWRTTPRFNGASLQ